MTVVPAAQVRLLDGFSLHIGERDPPSFLGQLPRGVQRLVAHLSLSGRPTRAAIVGDLWPDVREEQAHGSLRTALWRLHKVAPGLVHAAGDVLSLADGVRVDVWELHDWARRVRDPRSHLDDVELADAGLRGELLPGWYDEWVLLERETLRQLRMHALEAVSDRLTAAGRHSEALEAAYAAVRADPLRESAHRTVVRVHLAEGNLAEAVRAFDRFRSILATELDAEPSEQMAGLVRGIRRPPGAPPTRTGNHSPRLDRDGGSHGTTGFPGRP